jgi:DNA-binding MarR family transcriptional regulator
VKHKRSTKQIVNQVWPTPPKEEIEAAGKRVLSRLRTELDKHDTSLRSLYGDGWSAAPLKQREFQILTAVAQVAGPADAGAVAGIAGAWIAGLTIADAGFALERLEERGLVESRRSRPEGMTEVRQRFQMTEDGERALARAHVEGKQLADAREGFPEDGLVEKSD